MEDGEQQARRALNRTLGQLVGGLTEPAAPGAPAAPVVGVMHGDFNFFGEASAAAVEMLFERKQAKRAKR